ncbi:hypothetical protein [Nonomuraea sp. NBC_00507]|uniref:hypothetical protein n=1 Tax=Nonomuraea sp. NBC_00507 TaxID=2976002 RepID=UPI002E17CA9C
MPFSEIEYGVADRIATITLNRPDRLNALTFAMRGELAEAFDLAGTDDEEANFPMKVSRDLPSAVPFWPENPYRS